MKHLQRVAALFALGMGALLTSGCTTAVVLMHLHEKLTEGDARPCVQLSSVERALETRCGAFVAGSLVTKEVMASGLPVCPLTLAARDPRLWPVLPELLQRGAQPELCPESPMVALAQALPCPDFAAASPASLESLRWLAEADARAIHHDVVRALSCPSARAAHLGSVLDTWLAQGLLPVGELAFSPLGALHPSYIGSDFAQRLEALGHGARGAFGSYDGRLPPGFEEALRNSDWVALDWWLLRLPALANKVPSARANQLPWVPLVRVLTPSFMPDAAQQRTTVEYLLSRGADPSAHLPHEPSQTVLTYAQRLKSPLVPMLDASRSLPTTSVQTPMPPLPVAQAAAVRGEATP